MDGLSLLLLIAAVAFLFVTARLRDRVRRLEGRLQALERGLAPSARADAAAEAPVVVAAPAPPPAEPARPASPEPIAEASPASAPPPAPPARPAEPAPSPAPEPASPSARPTPSLGQVEARLGVAWLNRAGVVVLLLGIAFFLKYAFENDWIGPTGRVAIGFLAGIGFLGLGERQRAAYRVAAQGLLAVGLGTLYLSVYAAYGFYGLVPLWSAFVLMVLVTATGMALAIRDDARAIALLANLGGFLTPVVLGTGTDAAAALFTYLAILDAGMLASAFWRRWTELHLLSFAFTHALYWDWHWTWYRPERLPVALEAASVFFVLFALVAPVEAARRRESGGWRAAPLLVFAAPTLYFLAARAVLYPAHAAWLGLLCLALATAYFLGGRWALAAASPGSWLPLFHFTLALVFLTLTFPVQFTEHGVTIAWSVQGVALLWGGFRLGTRRLRSGALLVLALAGARWWTLIEPRQWHGGLVVIDHPAFVPTLVFATACALAALLYRTGAPEAAGWESVARPLLLLAAIGSTALFLTDALADHAGLRLPASHLDVLRTVIWTAAAVPVLALAPRDRTRVLFFAGGVLLAAVGLHAATVDAERWRNVGPPVLNLRFGSGLLIAALYAVFAGMADDFPIATAANRARLRAVAAVAAALFLLWHLSAEILLMPLPRLREVEAIKARNMGLSILWTVYAFVAMGLGLWRDRAALRIGAIALFGLAVVKVLLVDLATLDAIYRILSFLVLGGVLLLASFLYTRYRARVQGHTP
ncbi:MAG TPA: DUF2339 domain-containing protein [Methylomirabilota bacterium]|nr:DUF2339 domain-containing protein [Methylomirabilota bacterium]